MNRARALAVVMSVLFSLSALLNIALLLLNEATSNELTACQNPDNWQLFYMIIETQEFVQEPTYVPSYDPFFMPDGVELPPLDPNDPGCPDEEWIEYEPIQTY